MFLKENILERLESGTRNNKWQVETHRIEGSRIIPKEFRESGLNEGD